MSEATRRYRVRLGKRCAAVRLCLIVVIVALINWWLSVPVPEAPRELEQKPEGNYVGDAIIFLLCLVGVMYQKKREAERED